MCLGVPGQVVEFLGNHIAWVDVSGNLVKVSIRLTPEVKVGEYVLIHAGFAMQVIEEEQARETMEILEELHSYAWQ